MRVYLHIGLEEVGADRLQSVLSAARDELATGGVLYPSSPGGKNHTRLYMAVTDPDHVDPLRFNRGYITPDKQNDLRRAVADGLAKEIAPTAPDTLILSAAQLGGSLHRRSELERLRALLSPFSDDIVVVAHVDEPARLLARHYAAQVLEGRAAPLNRELTLAQGDEWWAQALDAAPPIDPQAGQFLETQAAAFWLDYTALVSFWEDVFGAGRVHLRRGGPDRFDGAAAAAELSAAFGIAIDPPADEPGAPIASPSAAWLARGRQFNALLLQLLARREHVLPRPVWRGFMSEMMVPGDPLDPGALAAVSAHFAEANAALAARHDGLSAADFDPPATAATWTEADPERGFRASQYLLSFMFQIEKATKAERKAKASDLARLAEAADTAPAPDPAPAPVAPAPASPPPRRRAAKAPAAPGPDLSPEARALMTPLAIQNFEKLKRSSFAPHNGLGAVDEEQLAAAFTPASPRKLPKGSSGNVIVGCMKNEAPYILEWVAYHRAIGVDNFLIYTNDCTDGTAEILDRLQEMGLVEHRNNDEWKGNSPQQFALNRALEEDVIRNAEWIIHIDVDEFINVRVGNGTLPEFLRKVPDATNVAMTWRLFGHNGVARLADDFVIDQFDRCAPRFCPKPHTVWGFKTMFKNIGAYGKLSCHRPNKLDEARKDQVRWVNGSGLDMTKEAIDNGWRSSKKSIGYDLLQLNHYALRSAESFLIKRQRGRALHVDRSIGLNYWIRMDWSDFRDVTIKRNLPRLRAEYDALLEDDTLRQWHEAGLDWHRAKAEELHAMPEFEELYQQALKMKLTETERVAYALALDMES